MNQQAAIMAAMSVMRRTFAYVKDHLSTGVSEKELARLLIRHLRQAGYASLSFKPIVAFGSNAAYPHHIPGNRQLQRNQIVLVDFGFKNSGWCTDLTRTFFYGRPGARFKQIYRVVLKAQQAAIHQLKISHSGKEIDETARAVIIRAGYTKALRHATGHGLGKRIHQPPWLSSKRKYNTTLKDRDVVTVEPGIYIKGWGGIRIEDMVMIGSTPKVLSQNIEKKLSDIVV